jgi:heme/copper-type cytochrome/quinol oxidase subunit 2
MDSIIDPELTVKIIASQWFWSYEYKNINLDLNLSYDSFLKSDQYLNIGELRQLQVDNFLILPIFTHIRLLVTSNDVIHSFALPNLAIKIDAIPGR